MPDINLEFDPRILEIDPALFGKQPGQHRLGYRVNELGTYVISSEQFEPAPLITDIVKLTYVINQANLSYITPSLEHKKSYRMSLLAQRINQMCRNRDFLINQRIQIWYIKLLLFIPLIQRIVQNQLKFAYDLLYVHDQLVSHTNIKFKIHLRQRMRSKAAFTEADRIALEQFATRIYPDGGYGEREQLRRIVQVVPLFDPTYNPFAETSTLEQLSRSYQTLSQIITQGQERDSRLYDTSSSYWQEAQSLLDSHYEKKLASLFPKWRHLQKISALSDASVLGIEGSTPLRKGEEAFKRWKLKIELTIDERALFLPRYSERFYQGIDRLEGLLNEWMIFKVCKKERLDLSLDEIFETSDYDIIRKRFYRIKDSFETQFPELYVTLETKYLQFVEKELNAKLSQPLSVDSFEALEEQSDQQSQLFFELQRYSRHWEDASVANYERIKKHHSTYEAYFRAVDFLKHEDSTELYRKLLVSLDLDFINKLSFTVYLYIEDKTLFTPSMLAQVEKANKLVNLAYKEWTALRILDVKARESFYIAHYEKESEKNKAMAADMLGIYLPVTDEIWNASYRQLTLLLHPDKFCNDPPRFHALFNEAYKLLNSYCKVSEPEYEVLLPPEDQVFYEEDVSSSYSQTSSYRDDSDDEDRY